MATITDMLREKGVILPNATPMKSGEYDLAGGVPIIDIEQRPRPDRGYDFMLYDNVTNDGRTLIQGKGTQYAISIRSGEFRVEEERTIDDSLPFGVVGIYPNDYFMASRSFVQDLEKRCE